MTAPNARPHVVFDDSGLLLEQEWPVCSACGTDADHEDCERCGATGVVDHDCGEDTCCCADPVDNVPCDECGGAGAHWKCLGACGYIDAPPRLSIAPTTEEADWSGQTPPDVADLERQFTRDVHPLRDARHPRPQDQTP